jgi:hypothetical protein
VRRRLLAEHRALRALAAGPERWPYTRTGADLWIDGLAALQAADERIFTLYLDAFLDYAARAGSPVTALAAGGLASLLGLFEPFLLACAEHDPRSFWPGLAVGVCLVQAAGGPPRIEVSEAVVINGTLLVLLSPSYRGLRFTAFNEGIRTRALPGRKAPVFRPEHNFFFIAPPDLVEAEPLRAQFYVVNHDLSHVVLFADAYLRPVGSPAVTASLLLNAEETACTFDLVLAAELLRFGVDLHAFAEMRRMEEGWREGRGSVMERAGRGPESLASYQTALKSAAQHHLRRTSPLSARIAGAPVPPDLSGWFAPAAQKMHAVWSEKLADRVWNPLFQRFVSLLPPLPGHLENLVQFTHDTWRVGQQVAGGPVPEACAETRARSVVANRLRFLVIRAAELAVMMSKRGRVEPVLLEDLTAWGLAVVDDSIRVRNGKGDPVAGRVEEVRGLLARHAVDEAPAWFDDPMASP